MPGHALDQGGYVQGAAGGAAHGVEQDLFGALIEPPAHDRLRRGHAVEALGMPRYQDQQQRRKSVFQLLVRGEDNFFLEVAGKEKRDVAQAESCHQAVIVGVAVLAGICVLVGFVLVTLVEGGFSIAGISSAEQAVIIIMAAAMMIINKNTSLFLCMNTPLKNYYFNQ